MPPVRLSEPPKPMKNGVKPSSPRPPWRGFSLVFSFAFSKTTVCLVTLHTLAGPGERLALARYQHTIYFRQHPTESDREYLYHVFRTVRLLPGLAALFHDTHNPVWHLGLSGDGAQLLLEFWQKLNAEEGQDQEHAPLAHDFTDANLDIVTKQSAPVITFSQSVTDDECVSLFGLLNSSSACFWGRQTFFPKGGFGDGKWEERLEWDSTKLVTFPIPPVRLLALAQELDRLAQELNLQSPSVALANTNNHIAAVLDAAKHRWTETMRRMIGVQEELDWECYQLYNLTEAGLVLMPDQLPLIQLGERAFEIIMARKMAAGELETAWFSRHGSTPITELPTHWPAAYRQLVERRIALIESDRNIALIEQPEYKRRWNTEPWEQQQERALREWLLARLEDPRYWPAPELTSCAHLADKVRRDAEFMEVAALYRNRPDFDLTELVVELVESESVQFLPVLRYKESGLRKRAIWESVWNLQREEDRLQAQITGLVAAVKQQPEKAEELQSQIAKLKSQIPEIPVPPKYDTKDFASGPCWSLRGKLDVPKERFIT
jgi:hypothetical protein